MPETACLGIRKYQKYCTVYGVQCPQLFPLENYFLVLYTLETNDNNFSNIREVDLYKEIYKFWPSTFNVKKYIGHETLQTHYVMLCNDC